MADRKDAMRQAMQELLSMGDSIKDPAEATVLESDGVLFGDLRAEGDVTVSGRFKGNLTATGTVRVTGKLLGDVKGKMVSLEGGAVRGDITAGQVTLDTAAILIGNARCDALDCAGKVKGDLTVTGDATFRAGAILIGDASAETVTVHPDAQLQGNVRQRDGKMEE